VSVVFVLYTRRAAIIILCELKISGISKNLSNTALEIRTTYPFSVYALVIIIGVTGVGVKGVEPHCKSTRKKKIICQTFNAYNITVSYKCHNNISDVDGRNWLFQFPQKRSYMMTHNNYMIGSVSRMWRTKTL